MKTKAVLFPEANKFEMIDLDLGKPTPEDIVVRTLVSAISPGTERWILRGKHAGTSFPCVPGYHRIGIIEECGKQVKEFQPGDIVYGSCNRWENEVKSMWGAHVGCSVSSPNGYFFVSSSMPSMFELETMAFTILAGVAYRGVDRLNVSEGDTVLIIGAGFVGICAAQLCSFRRARPILIEKDPQRAVFAKKLIPDVYCTEDTNFEASIPGGIDIVYDTAGHPDTIDRMVKRMRRWGTILLQAQYFDKQLCAIDLDEMKTREITAKTTCGVSRQDWVSTIELIRKRILAIGPLITHRFESKEILKGYKLLHTGKPFNLGIVFNWNA